MIHKIKLFFEIIVIKNEKYIILIKNHKLMLHQFIYYISIILFSNILVSLSYTFIINLNLSLFTYYNWINIKDTKNLIISNDGILLFNYQSIEMYILLKIILLTLLFASHHFHKKYKIIKNDYFDKTVKYILIIICYVIILLCVNIVILGILFPLMLIIKIILINEGLIIYESNKNLFNISYAVLILYNFILVIFYILMDVIIMSIMSIILSHIKKKILNKNNTKK